MPALTAWPAMTSARLAFIPPILLEMREPPGTASTCAMEEDPVRKSHPASWPNGNCHLAAAHLRKAGHPQPGLRARSAPNYFLRRLRDLEAMLPHLPQRPLRQVLPEITPAQRSNRLPKGGVLPGMRPKPDVRRRKRRPPSECLPATAAPSSLPRKPFVAGCLHLGSVGSTLAQQQARAQHRPFRESECGNHRYRLRHLWFHIEGLWSIYWLMTHAGPSGQRSSAAKVRI